MRTSILLLPLLFLTMDARAEDATAIIARAAAAQETGNAIQTLRITRTDRNGQTDVKTLETHTRLLDGLEQNHVVLREPQELAGMQFLSRSTSTGVTEAWIYMPAGDNVMEISGSQRKSAFMGTDFSYEDMEIGDPALGTHVLDGEESVTVGGTDFDCHKVTTTPRADLGSAYSRLVAWVDRASGLPRLVLFHDASGAEKKRMTFEAFAQEGDRSLPTRILMEDLKRGTSTLLEVLDYRLGVPSGELPDAMFDPEQLHTFE